MLQLAWPLQALAEDVALFEFPAVVSVRLSGPLSEVFADQDAREYRPFTLETGGISIPLKVRVRGHSRVKVCEFPPLKLNFAQGAGQGTPFAGQDKLKLVTHCRNSDRGEQDLLEEYAAYRIFNQLTETSYRTHLLRIDYVDTAAKTPDDATPRYGFVIESLESLAGRLGAQPALLEGLPVHRQDLQQSSLVYVFQYLIANTDYMMLRADHEEVCCQNIDLLEKNGKVLMVPFDFDLAGLVNARYAFPDRILRIDRVTQRLYRGLCMDSAWIESALNQVRGREQAILDSVREIPGLTEKNSERALNFIRRFFEDAEDADDLLENFEKRCIDGY